MVMECSSCHNEKCVRNMVICKHLVVSYDIQSQKFTHYCVYLEKETDLGFCKKCSEQGFFPERESNCWQRKRLDKFDNKLYFKDIEAILIAYEEFNSEMGEYHMKNIYPFLEAVGKHKIEILKR